MRPQEKVSQRFEFLDGLRGLAALGVVFFHFNGTLKDHGVLNLPNFIDAFCELGHFGVQIFFVLSGFVIAYSLRDEKFSSFFCLRFFIKRSIRLDPPYWMIVGFLVMLNFLGNYFFSKRDGLIMDIPQIFTNLLYLPDILEKPRILPVAWTLCIEIQFYMIFVLFLQIAQFLTFKFYPGKGFSFYQSYFTFALFGPLMMISILQNTSWALLPPISGLFIPYWYSFFIGCLTCWTILKFVHSSILWTCFALICGYIFFHGSSDAIATLVVALTIYLVAAFGGMHRLLTSQFFQYSGKISYSLYLIHWPIGMKFIDLSFRFLGDYLHHMGSILILIILSLFVTYLAAHCFYYMVEYPSLHLSRKMKMNDLELRQSPNVNF